MMYKNGSFILITGTRWALSHRWDLGIEKGYEGTLLKCKSTRMLRPVSGRASNLPGAKLCGYAVK